MVDLQILNDAITGDAAELVHIVEVEGKGRGMVAKKDIAIGMKIVTDRPLAASIYGVEIMPIKYGFKDKFGSNKISNQLNRFNFSNGSRICDLRASPSGEYLEPIKRRE